MYHVTILDTETTGLYPYKGHEMIAFAGIKLDKDLQEIDRLHIHIWPTDPRLIDSKAIKINKFSLEEWAKRDATSPQNAAPMIADFMEGCVPVAHNWPFDRGFILKMMSDHVPQKKILRRGIDTITLAIAALLPRGHKSVSMSNIARIMGWPEQTHDALDDALMCTQLFRLCYPMGVRSVIKMQIALYRAKVALYVNPLRGQ